MAGSNARGKTTCAARVTPGRFALIQMRHSSSSRTGRCSTGAEIGTDSPAGPAMMIRSDPVPSRASSVTHPWDTMRNPGRGLTSRHVVCGPSKLRTTAGSARTKRGNSAQRQRIISAEEGVGRKSIVSKANDGNCAKTKAVFAKRTKRCTRHRADAKNQRPARAGGRRKLGFYQHFRRQARADEAVRQHERSSACLVRVMVECMQVLPL